jgi:hypothetical protein
MAEVCTRQDDAHVQRKSGRSEMNMGVTPEERHRMIAETAYFLAQERGFTGGDPVSDWIEAERRVDRQLLTLATARLVERLESGVATAAKNLSSLKRRVSTMAADARIEFNADVERLDALRSSLRSKLEELKDRSEEVSQKALHQAENVWNELSETLQRVTARTRH